MIEKKEFGRRSRIDGKEKPSGFENLLPPTLSVDTICDTFNDNRSGSFHPDLKHAIDTDRDVAARAAEIVGLVNQGRKKDVTEQMLEGITKAFNAARGKK